MSLEELIHNLPTFISGANHRLTIYPWLDGCGITIEISGIHRETRMFEYSMVFLEIMGEIKERYGDYVVREEGRGCYSLMRPEDWERCCGLKPKTFAEYYKERIININDL